MIQVGCSDQIKLKRFPSEETYLSSQVPMCNHPDRNRTDVLFDHIMNSVCSAGSTGACCSLHNAASDFTNRELCVLTTLTQAYRPFHRSCS
ncbi:hypothetical protein CHARACLAT_025253 [Characodon lateralis]|uniref:Uncharacterized protein n=1 Tax=Characodon lateralis TaxID=208331 RepID=A0ABU7EM97_9TELE|nr:hypothetical protein [Characodon lateralis]